MRDISHFLVRLEWAVLEYSPSKPNGGQRKISLPKMTNRFWFLLSLVAVKEK